MHLFLPREYDVKKKDQLQIKFINLPQQIQNSTFFDDFSTNQEGQIVLENINVS
jgi:hypothetical protein